MIISYKKLWKLLVDRELKKTDLIEVSKISSNTLAKLGKNEPVSMETLHRICISLNCDVGDILSFIIEEGENL